MEFLVHRSAHKYFLLAITAFALLAVAGRAAFVDKVGSNRHTETAQADQESDISKWPKIKNVTGWMMRYPPDWEDATETFYGDDLTFETSDFVYIQGPRNCSPQAARCALVGIRRYSRNNAYSEATLEEYLAMSRPGYGSTEFLKRTRTAFAGESALDVCGKGNSDGKVSVIRQIVFKHDGYLFEISYQETEKSGRATLEIKVPQDWKYTARFEKMLSTFSFYEIPRHSNRKPSP
jgi:hypothetical protein